MCNAYCLWRWQHIVQFIGCNDTNRHNTANRANTAASGQPQLLQPGVNGAGILNQGSLEASNVNVVEEMVNMIETQRAYEINSKSISAVDSMLKFLNQNM